MNNPQQANSAVTGLLDRLRDVIQQLPGQSRRMVNDFWALCRGAIRELETTIADKDQQIRTLEAALQNARVQVPPTPQRPPTTSTVASIRDGFDQHLSREAALVQELSENIEAIFDLDQGWALRYLQARRVPGFYKGPSAARAAMLGCWDSRHEGDKKSGRVRANISKDLRPDNNQPFGVQPYVYQLAVVAAGNGYQLRMCGRKQAGEEDIFECSHLCHNIRCFNPQHVVVEDQDINKARNQCANSFTVTTEDGTTIDPCTHWDGVRRVRCLLPRYRLPPGSAGKRYDTSRKGPINAGANEASGPVAVPAPYQAPLPYQINVPV